MLLSLSIGQNFCYIDKYSELVYITAMKKILKKNRKRMRAIAMRKKGLTYQAIADKLRVSRERVRQYIKGNPKLKNYDAEKRHARYMAQVKRNLEGIK